MKNDNELLTFNIDPEDFPLGERIRLRDSVAFFESQANLESDIGADLDFLGSLSFSECWGGACDFPIHPCIIVPSSPYRGLPDASTVLKDLRAVCFRSEHIGNLDTQPIAFPGYNPGTENDEIHNDSSKQYMFASDEDAMDKETEWSFSPVDSKNVHDSLCHYVLNRQLYYVLLHVKPNRDPAFKFTDYANWVILFAVGVSSKTGNLVGAVTHQACHNLCD